MALLSEQFHRTLGYKGRFLRWGTMCMMSAYLVAGPSLEPPYFVLCHRLRVPAASALGPWTRA